MAAVSLNDVLAKIRDEIVEEGHGASHVFVIMGASVSCFCFSYMIHKFDMVLGIFKQDLLSLLSSQNKLHKKKCVSFSCPKDPSVQKLGSQANRCAL